MILKSFISASIIQRFNNIIIEKQMAFNVQNPFTRPSPFRPSIQNRSTSPYSYGNQYANIIQSQVRPVLTSNRTNPNPFSQKTIDLKQLTSTPAYRPSSSYNSITSYTNLNIPTSDTRPEISKQYGGNIYQQKPSITKQNPFNRPSLLNNYTAISTQSNRPSLNFSPSITNTQLQLNFGASYDHLRYIPNSNPKSAQKIQSQKNIEKYGFDHGLSNQKYLGNDYAQAKYPTYNYSSYNNDKSETSSVCTYINKINELQEPKSPRDKFQNNPFNRKSIFNNPGITAEYSQPKPQSKKEDQVLIYSGLKIESKDYSHLQYKGANTKQQNQVKDAISYSSGLDKYRYQYEKERKYQQNDLAKASVQREKDYHYTKAEEPGFGRINLEQITRDYLISNGDMRVEINNYEKFGKNEKKYEFEDYKQEQDFQNSPKNNPFEENPKNLISDKYNEKQNRFITSYKQQSFDNHRKGAYHKQNEEIQSDRYDFKNEDQLERVVGQKNKNYDYRTYEINSNRVSLQSYQSPQFGTLNPTNNIAYKTTNITKQNHQNYTKKVAQNEYNRGNIVRFDDSFESQGRQQSRKQRDLESYDRKDHYLERNQYKEKEKSELGKETKKNGPIKEAKEEKGYPETSYPNRIRHKGIQYQLVKLFS